MGSGPEILAVETGVSRLDTTVSVARRLTPRGRLVALGVVVGLALLAWWGFHSWKSGIKDVGRYDESKRTTDAVAGGREKVTAPALKEIHTIETRIQTVPVDREKIVERIKEVEVIRNEKLRAVDNAGSVDLHRDVLAHLRARNKPDATRIN